MKSKERAKGEEQSASAAPVTEYVELVPGSPALRVRCDQGVTSFLKSIFALRAQCGRDARDPSINMSDSAVRDWHFVLRSLRWALCFFLTLFSFVVTAAPVTSNSRLKGEIVATSRNLTKRRQVGALQKEVKVEKEVSLSQPLTVSWRYNTPETVNLTPAFDDERVYLPLAGGIIVSLQATTGQLNWRSEMGGEISASPVADNHLIYVASETGKPEAGVRRATGALRALGREGGVTQWMRTFEMPLRGALTLANGKLFAASANGRVYAFDSKNGSVVWVYDYGAPFNAQPVVSGSRVYVGSEDGNLLAFDESNGKLLWFYKTKGPVRGPVTNGEEHVYFGSDDGYVYAVNTANGKLQWRSRTGAGVQSVVRIGDDLLVASLDNFVYKFSLAGTRLWKRQLSGRLSSQPLMTQDEALFTPLSGSAGIVLELRDGRQVNTLPLGEEISNSASPIAVANAVLLTTESGLLAFMRPKTVKSEK